MTISSDTRKAGPYDGNDSTTAFPFAFKVFATSDILVTLTDDEGVETAAVLDSDYSVSLNADQNNSPGGTVTYPVSGDPLATDYQLTISGALDELQPTSLSNGGGFYPAVIENALDRSVIYAQQLREAVTRALKFPVSDASSLSADLPAASLRASKFLVFDADGNPIASTGTGADAGLREDLAESSGAALVGHSYEETITGAPAYLKTVSDIINSLPVSAHRWMTKAQIDDALNAAGAVDHTAAIQDAFESYNNITFDRGKYNLTAGATMNFDDAYVDFGEALFVCDFASGGFAFTFGQASQVPVRDGLVVNGGRFKQLDAATTQNSNFIRILGTENFEVFGFRFWNVSNGGLYIPAGNANGDVHTFQIKDASGHATCRGVWLDGSNADDFASQLIDISSITKNATAVPTKYVNNIRVRNFRAYLAAYAVYFINTRYCRVEDFDIDISGSGLRGITLNNYAPYTHISRGRIRGDQAARGILVTQYSHDVFVDDVTFLGTFGGGSDVYAQYLAEVFLTNCKHLTDSTQNILMDMGAYVSAKRNYYTRPSGYSANARVVKLTNIDEAVSGSSTYGNTATSLPGLTFQHNEVRERQAVVMANMLTAANGNIPGIDAINNTDNILYDRELAAASDEYGMRLYANGSTYPIKYRYARNRMHPEANADRNFVSISGSGYVSLEDDTQFAVFQVSIAAAGGAITVTKIFGGNFSCAVTRSADDIIVAPRTIAGAAGASVAVPVSITDLGGNVYSHTIFRSATNYQVRLLDSAGAQILLSTTAASFNICIAATNT